MKVAITSDLHLASRQQYPERYAALENILVQVRRMQINRLIIAGDLFDANHTQFGEFEAVCRLPENREVQILVIPGNHDANISRAAIAAGNVQIYVQPELVPLDEQGPRFLFVPFREGQTMGETIASVSDRLQSGSWVLIGHGDWMGNIQSANAYEPGIYMPLSQRDLDFYTPSKVFLGHIHAPYDSTRLFYPGSPCGMNITETGRRRFLSYDTLTNTVASHWVDTQLLFFSRTFTVYPVRDEAAALGRSLSGWIDSWGLQPGEKQKARVRVKLNGYSADKSLLKQVVVNTLSGYQLYEEPDLLEVSLAADTRRGQLVELIKEQLNQLALPNAQDDPGTDEILLAAIQLVYGG